jgi:O-antigen ligase
LAVTSRECAQAKSPRLLAALPFCAIFIWLLLALITNIHGRGHYFSFIFSRHTSSLNEFSGQVLLFAIGVITALTSIYRILGRRDAVLMLGWTWFIYAFVTSRSIGEANLVYLQAIPLIVYGLPKTVLNAIISLVSGTVFFCLVLSLIFFLLNVGQFQTPGYGIRASGIFYSPNTLYVFALVSFYFFLYLDANNTSITAIGRIYKAAIALSVLLVFCAGNRSGILGMCASLFILPQFRRPIGRLICIAVIIIGLLLTVSRTTNSMSTIGLDKASISRTRIWANGLQEVMVSPVFGSGMSGFMYSEVYTREHKTKAAYPSECKNLLLSMLVSFGIVGTLLFLTFYIFLLKSRDATRASRRNVIACIVALGVSGLFDTPVIIGMPRTPGSFLLSFLLGLYLYEIILSKPSVEFTSTRPISVAAPSSTITCGQCGLSKGCS